MKRKLNEQLRLKIVEYEKDLTLDQNSKKYIQDTIRAVKKCAYILRDLEMDKAPSKIGREELNAIREAIPRGTRNPNSPRNQQFHVETFRTFLKYYHVKTPKQRWPGYEPMRPKTSENDFEKVLDDAYKANDWQAVALLVLEGVTSRRIALERLKDTDITPVEIILNDKGRGGPKMRKIPLSAETKSILDWCRMKRKENIEKVKTSNPNAIEPEEFIIWYRANTMNGCGRTTLDSFLKRAEARSGIHLEHHALRRRGCDDLARALSMRIRKMASEDTDLGSSLGIFHMIKATLKISGHKKFEDFLKYIGEDDAFRTSLMTDVSELRKARRKDGPN